MNSKCRKTLGNIFHDPVKSNINWQDIETLFITLGARVEEGSGSRVRVYLNGIRAIFHRPNPEKETNKGAVKSVRRFLNNAGVYPEGD